MRGSLSPQNSRMTEPLRPGPRQAAPDSFSQAICARTPPDAYGAPMFRQKYDDTPSPPRAISTTMQHHSPALLGKSFVCARNLRRRTRSDTANSKTPQPADHRGPRGPIPAVMVQRGRRIGMDHKRTSGRSMPGQSHVAATRSSRRLTSPLDAVCGPRASRVVAARTPAPASPSAKRSTSLRVGVNSAARRDGGARPPAPEPTARGGGMRDRPDSGGRDGRSSAPGRAGRAGRRYRPAPRAWRSRSRPCATHGGSVSGPRPGGGNRAETRGPNAICSGLHLPPREPGARGRRPASRRPRGARGWK